MTNDANRALLPAGLADILPPDAAHEAEVTEGLMAAFAGYGYDRVKPPLFEFEDTLLAGSGVATAEQTFRFMDPVSQRMLGLRPDMTIQVARIAASRLKESPRPLRLGYAGQVLRVKGSTLRPERQFGQVGAELIGSDSAGADAEIIKMATDALIGLGVPDLSVDLGMPTLVPAICADLGLDLAADGGQLRTALNQKDAAQIAQLGGQAATILGQLLAAAGPAEKTLETLAALALPGPALDECQRLEDVVALVRARAPDLTLTIDPVEIRGYEYHTGVTFTIFSTAGRGELGRGGRYNIDGNGESATGITLFMDSLLRVLPNARTGRRLFLPYGAPEETSQRLRDEGWPTIAALTEDLDAAAEARRLGCTHMLAGGTVQAVEE